MTRRTSIALTRRGFLEALASVSTLALLTRYSSVPRSEFVEIDGWILKRSDLA
ncbi:hypothetical protein [Mesorhizobium sp. NBSH29]|uniref:hypothetical protein n=1 Tax=Mesorhizobium sp. NBSH29 TaxID=2654249 RepID=UPI0018967E10|nr:hypothetical protein [Mesorhizobium sp. NBSH29]